MQCFVIEPIQRRKAMLGQSVQKYHRSAYIFLNENNGSQFVQQICKASHVRDI
ncbi:hypothetical protein [Nostoc sp. MG11]|uniref:hypothetical protein n=1 Tax=Nostoc sp. MG11 TaxID=2721166 RepID=UPI001866D478|nr:hypothetical protein [Nostoc sp. MG11]